MPAPLVLLEGFSAPLEPWAAGHRGVDLAADPGTEIVAAGDGTVAFAGMVAGRGVVSLDHGPPERRVRTTYEPVAADVLVGQPVTRGQRIGVLAPGGTHCLLDCLHWGLRDLTAEQQALAGGGPYAGAPVYRDPMTLLTTPRIRLLPRLPEPDTGTDADTNAAMLGGVPTTDEGVTASSAGNAARAAAATPAAPVTTSDAVTTSASAQAGAPAGPAAAMIAGAAALSIAAIGVAASGGRPVRRQLLSRGP